MFTSKLLSKYGELAQGISVKEDGGMVFSRLAKDNRRVFLKKLV
ncbi:MAG: hypothetical protein ACD_63C00035G0004 [uncultured bacterium]|nr:MAG: hypothetical protein ACD_63C00035G0004 [uncultured bacterium]